MPKSTANLSNPFIRALASVVLQRGLHSVLVYDIPPTALNHVAALLSQMLQVVTEQEALCMTLGATDSEDDLWGYPTLRDDVEELTLGWRAKIIPKTYQDTRPRLMVIPNLANLSLAAARACVMLLGNEVIHLERHGRSQCISPNLWWLAGCASDEIGAVSLHLLDRFSLRLSGQMLPTSDRVQAIKTWLAQESVPHSDTVLTSGIGVRLRQAVQQWPSITDQALARVLEYEQVLSSTRRTLTLTRLATAIARLESASSGTTHQVAANHVDIAAQMIHLKSPLKPQQETEIPEKPQKVPQKHELDETFSSPKTEEPDKEEPKINSSTQPSTEQKAYESPSTEFSPVAVDPYELEDKAVVQREAESLRLPPRYYRALGVMHGSVIGTQRATDLQDLAWVPSLLEAARFQLIRRQQNQHPLPKNQLIVMGSDLRSYRRLPVPEQMLAMVLDYTSVRDLDWQSELLPYLRWAYVERTSLCLIRVGAADAVEELRAERILARNLLVPRLQIALEAVAGKATPLAHGLELAYQTLRRALQQGRSTVERARLVVMTDGRGNVPLAASHINQITWPVKRQGVEDAMKIARQIRTLNKVEVILLNPNPKQYTLLPWELKEALDASMFLFSSSEDTKANYETETE
ncbi:MAG: hypothetical protein DRR19_00970 [Candidatus Parabeggiatoa sp. nov. 1]|nr:MAG: hypothetical protein DRR19_00970 [Gammaproteobacteria bacterium]